MERFFAVKFVWIEASANPVVPELVQREGLVLSMLAGHPNIISASEMGVLGGTCVYLQMDYAEGEDLHKTLSHGLRMPVDLALYVTASLCAALEHAHERRGPDGQRVIHRDIKPPNVILTKHGDVKLVDFGVAKLAAGHTLTRLAGTPGYFAPELFTIDGSPSPQSDLFSVGVILFEMLTGARLFYGETEQQVYARTIACEIPAPSAYGVSLSHAVERIMYTLLAKDPNLRFVSAAQALEAIRATPEGRAAGPYELKLFLAAHRPTNIPTPAGVPAHGVTPAHVPSTSAAGVPAGVGGTFSVKGESVLTRTRRGRPRTRIILIAAGVAVAGAGAATVAVTMRNREGPASAVAARQPDARPPPAAVARVAPDAGTKKGRLTIAVTPPDARVTVDGNEIKGPPFLVTEAAPGAVVRVRVERDGYETYERDLRVDDEEAEDARVPVALVAVPPVQPAERPKPVPPRRHHEPPERQPVTADETHATEKALEPKSIGTTPGASPSPAPAPEKKLDKNATKKIPIP
jgi:serine/threonine-protein kinase